jgi:hypothetical protein
LPRSIDPQKWARLRYRPRPWWSSRFSNAPPVVRQSWTAHDPQQRLTITSRWTLRGHAIGTIPPGEALHRIPTPFLLLFARDHYLPLVIASARISCCLPWQPPFRSLATLCRVAIPIARGTAVPGGLVQHIFSPPARVNRFALTPLPWPRHRAKNALCYVARHITVLRHSVAFSYFTW